MKNSILLVCLVVGSVVMVGCKSEQMIMNTSGSGLNTDLSVPIPGTTTTVIGMKLTLGTWKSTSIIQPVATNLVYVPSTSIANHTVGKQSLFGSVSVSTNTSASIDSVEQDNYLFETGDSLANVRIGTNTVMRVDGYQGFNPLQNRTNTVVQ